MQQVPPSLACYHPRLYASEQGSKAWTGTERRAPVSLPPIDSTMARLVAAGAVGAATAVAVLYILKKRPSGFLALVTEAEAIVGATNILTPAEVKQLLATTPDALLLDVQDGGDKVEGSHRASLGTLVFKASTDLAAFKDPTIADRRKDSLIVVNCGLGGQAKLGAAMLVDYGFTNVKVQTHDFETQNSHKHSNVAIRKHGRAVLVDYFPLLLTPLLLAMQVIDGGCDAYFKAFPDSKAAKKG